MFLITTADERAWNKSEKNIYLGEWCKLYSRKHIWGKLDYPTLPYHWDNRNKYFNDYKYLSDIYEKYLSIMVIEMNKIHHVKYSKRLLRNPLLSYL